MLGAFEIENSERDANERAIADFNAAIIIHSQSDGCQPKIL